MTEYKNEEVPFIVMADGRQYLTDTQIAEMPWLMDFIAGNASCFARESDTNCWLYYPNGDAPC